MEKKSIVIIDTPNSCVECPFFDNSHYNDIFCRAHPNRWSINYPIPQDSRQDWCPLKEGKEVRVYNRKKSISKKGYFFQTEEEV